MTEQTERKKNENSDSIRICASWKYRKISKEDCRRLSGLVVCGDCGAMMLKRDVPAGGKVYA